MMKEFKIEKEFLITDSTVNTYGFRLLTSGYMIDEFKKNPIGYYMHCTNEFSRNEGVLIRWCDFRIAGDSVFAKPIINLSHPRGQRTLDEVNSGFLNAASVGSIVVIESTEDAKLKLKNQTGATVTKWYNRECSLVDLPGNYNALVLYNKDGKQLDLNLFAPKATTMYEQAEKNISIDEIINQAIKNKNITSEQAEPLRKNYAGNPLGLNNILKDFAAMRLRWLMSQEWEYLDKNSLLPELKEKYEEGYALRFYIKFGKMPDWYVQAPSLSFNDMTKLELERLIDFCIELGFIDESTIQLLYVRFGSDYNGYKNHLLTLVKNGIEPLKKQTWDELDKAGSLEKLKKKCFASYKEKFYEKFGVEYKDFN